MKNSTIYRFVFAGGGTGGHLYPALAVAQQIRILKPEAEILFVGAKNKIESRVVPEYGFDFKSINVTGFSRKINLSNLLFPVKLFISMIQSILIAMKFKPRVAIGSGAYVSGPVVWASSVLGAKIILLEQNSYPGVTNRLLEKKAQEIHLTFEEAKKYFRQLEKLKVTGNPVRVNMKLINKAEEIEKFGLKSTKKTLLVLGGSGGAKVLNDAIANNIKEFVSKGIQIVWQTGQFYYDSYKKYESESVKVMAFINEMSSAYSSCDLVLARAGATTIAEVSYLGLPVVFVPSINVAANHQLMNAKALIETNAALMIEEKRLAKDLVKIICDTINNESLLTKLKNNISSYAKPDAAKVIADRAIKLAEAF